MLRRRALALAVVLSTTAGAMSAHADDLADEAELHFQLAADAWSKEDFRGALEHFLTSNRLVPNRNVVFNIARCYEQLKLLPEAYRSYTRALEGETKADSRKAIEEALGRVRKQVSVVHVKSNPPGATVYLDRKDLGARGTTPLTLGLNPGTAKVIVELPGYEPIVRDGVDLKVGADLDLALDLVPISGVVRIDGDAGALVHLEKEDAKAACEVPCKLSLSPGKHVLVVTRDGYQTADYAIDVPPNGETSVKASLLRFEVTAASRVSELVDDAPASVTVVTQQELRAMGYPTLADALRGIRGLYLSNDTAYDALGVLGFARPGDYGNRVLVLVDGHAANDNYIFSSYIGYDARVDLEDVDRIEVVRGPGSVLYGGSAFFAVINLITKARDDKSHGSAAVSAVGEGVTRARAGMYARLGPDAGIWASVAGARSSGRDYFFPDLVGQPDPNRPGSVYDGNARGLDGFDAGTLSGRLWWKAFTVQWHLTTRDKKLPGILSSTLFATPGSYYKDTRAFVEARFEPELSKSVHLFSRAHLDLYNFDSALQAVTPTQDPASYGTEIDRYRGLWGGLEQRLVYTPNDAVRLTLGGAYIRHFRTEQSGDTAVAPVVFDDKGNAGRNDPFSVAAAYANFDVAPSKAFKVSAGARLDYYSSLDKFDARAAFNPRVAIVTHPYPKGIVKLIVGKAFRAPSPYELYYASTTQIRPKNLDPEQIYSGELEYSHRFSSAIVGLVTAYASRVAGLIQLNDVATDAGSFSQYQNSDVPVSIYGAEAELRREWRQGFMLSGSFSTSRARYVDAPDLRNVPNSPSFLAAMKGATPLIGRQLMLMSRLAFEGPRWDGRFREGDEPQGKTSPGLIWDLVFSGELEPLQLRWSVGAYNIANWRYDTVPSVEFTARTVVQSGRTVLASLATRF